MEHWEDELEETLAGSELRRGELREGVVIDLKEDGLVVGIGTKRDGFVPKEDLEKIKEQTFSIGQPVNVIVTNSAMRRAMSNSPSHRPCCKKIGSRPKS
jgi:ribosomal protein S1